jgi:hypothetical protein
VPCGKALRVLQQLCRQQQQLWDSRHLVGSPARCTQKNIIPLNWTPVTLPQVAPTHLCQKKIYLKKLPAVI